MKNELVRKDSDATQRRVWSAAEAAAHPALGIHKPGSSKKSPSRPAQLTRTPKATVTPIRGALSPKAMSMQAESMQPKSMQAKPMQPKPMQSKLMQPKPMQADSSETLVAPAPKAPTLTSSETTVSPPPVAAAGSSETMVTATPKFGRDGERIDAEHLVVADEVDEELDGIVELSSTMLQEESEPLELLDDDLLEEVSAEEVSAEDVSANDAEVISLDGGELDEADVLEEVDSGHLSYVETQGEFEEKPQRAPSPVDVSSVSLSALHETLHNQAVDSGMATYTTGVPAHSLDRDGKSEHTFQIPAQKAPSRFGNMRTVLMAGVFLAGIGAGVFFGMPSGSSADTSSLASAEATVPTAPKSVAPALPPSPIAAPLAAITEDPNLGHATAAIAAPTVAALADVQPLDVQPLDVQPLKAQALDVQPLDVQPLDVQPLDVQPLDVQAPDVKPLALPVPEATPLEVKPAPKVRATPSKPRAVVKKKPQASKAVSGDPGVLMLGAKPPCDILIDGKKTGFKTPQRALRLPPGKHKVTLVNKEHSIRTSFRVAIRSGKTTRVVRDLTSRLR